MNPLPVYTRPAALQAGAPYYLRRRLSPAAPPHFLPVHFVAYTVCPAVVIVADSPGLGSPTAHFPCDRLDLYDICAD
jgi:hypothetical protein